MGARVGAKGACRVSAEMSEEEERFVAALRAVVAVAGGRGVSAASITGALLIIAGEVSAVRVGLGLDGAKRLTDAAFKGMASEGRAMIGGGS